MGAINCSKDVTCAALCCESESTSASSAKRRTKLHVCDGYVDYNEGPCTSVPAVLQDLRDVRDAQSRVPCKAIRGDVAPAEMCERAAAIQRASLALGQMHPAHVNLYNRKFIDALGEYTAAQEEELRIVHQKMSRKAFEGGIQDRNESVDLLGFYMETLLSELEHARAVQEKHLQMESGLADTSRHLLHGNSAFPVNLQQELYEASVAKGAVDIGVDRVRSAARDLRAGGSTTRRDDIDAMRAPWMSSRPEQTKVAHDQVWHDNPQMMSAFLRSLQERNLTI